MGTNYFTMDKLQKLEQLHKVAQEEGQKFYEKGNKQAGVRMRKALMDIKNLAHEIRKDKPSEKK